METVRQPGSRVDVEVPTDRICAVLFKGLERIYCISLTLTHLLSVFILNVTKYDNVLIRSLIEKQSRLSHQRVEPTSGLIHCLGDELCRELCLECFLILKRIMMLCKRHCTGVKPAVQNFRNSLHNAATLRTLQSDLIDIRSMKFYGKSLIIAGQFFKLCTAAYTLSVTTFTFPDI